LIKVENYETKGPGSKGSGSFYWGNWLINWPIILRRAYYFWTTSDFKGKNPQPVVK